MHRTELGYAVLLSLPVGVGVSMGTLKATGGELTDPLVVSTGIVAALAVFCLVVMGIAIGSTEQ